MEQQDIRWKQRFQNFDKAFLRLSKAMQIIRKEPDNFLLQAFQSGYIQEGDLWLQALNDRNLTTHTYDEETALSVANNIQTSYFPLLKALHTWLEIQAIVFGSRAKSNHKPGSDIDIAIKGSALTREDICSLAGAFEESLLPFFVDLLAYSSISNPELKAHIDRVGITIYKQ